MTKRLLKMPTEDSTVTSSEKVTDTLKDDGIGSSSEELTYRKIFGQFISEYITHTDKTPEYEEKFQEYIRDLYNFTFQSCIGFIVVFMVLLWPTDLIIYEDTALILDFFYVRLFVLLVATWYLVSINVSNFFSDYAPELFVVKGSALFLLMGLFLGPTGQFRITFWIAYLVPLFTIMLPLKFRARLFSSFIFGYTFYIPYYLNFDGQLGSRFFYSRLLVISIISLASTLLGHIFYHLNRRYYFGVIIKDEELQEIERHFKYKVSDSILQSIIEKPENIVEKGNRKEISILRINLKNFKTFKNQSGQKKITDHVNNILTFLSDCIRDYNGVLDQYWGSLITAEYGLLSVEKGNHGERACFSALEILSQWEQRLESLDAPANTLDLEMILHTGLATTGNFGTKNLMNLSAMGKTMEQASELKYINNPYNTRCIVTEPCYQKVKNNFAFRMLDRVNLKDQSDYITVYELLERVENLDETTKNLRKNYEKGLQLYWNTRFGEAIELFQNLIDEFPEDGPTKRLMERCKKFVDSPPPPDWNGASEISKIQSGHEDFVFQSNQS